MRKHIALADDEIMFYLHIPKTAGSSFYSYLRAQFPPENIAPMLMIDNGLQSIGKQGLNVDQYRLARGHCSYSIHQVLSKKAVFITMLRKPVDRVISLYKELRRVTTNPEHHLVKDATLMEFMDGRIHQAYNCQTRQIAGFISHDQRPEALTNPMFLEVAKENLAKFIFFGLAERFDDSIALLATLFGYPYEPVQRINVAPQSQETEIPTPEVIEKIREANQLDQELYEYGVQLFQERLKQVRFGITHYQTSSKIFYLFDRARHDLDRSFGSVPREKVVHAEK